MSAATRYAAAAASKLSVVRSWSKAALSCRVRLPIANSTSPSKLSGLVEPRRRRERPLRVGERLLLPPLVVGDEAESVLGRLDPLREGRAQVDEGGVPVATRDSRDARGLLGLVLEVRRLRALADRARSSPGHGVVEPRRVVARGLGALESPEGCRRVLEREVAAPERASFPGPTPASPAPSARASTSRRRARKRSRSRSTSWRGNVWALRRAFHLAHRAAHLARQLLPRTGGAERADPEARRREREDQRDGGEEHLSLVLARLLPETNSD